jgi:MFS transporter, DHA2 family, multidrug resistance protein
MATVLALNPDEPALKADNRMLLTIVVMLANIMQILDSTIANVAIPHLQSGLGATLDTVTWVLTSYILAAAVCVPLTGWLSDRLGSRNLFLFSVTGFTIASLLCATATSLEQMVIYRILQGMSGAFIMPLSQTVMLDINPAKKHPQAMAVWGMGVMIAPIFGPVIGGYLTENYSWEWIFLINVPIGIIVVALLSVLLPSRPLAPRRFDLFGFAMFALFIASLQLMLDRGNHEDWFDSWEIILEFGLAMAGLWIFIVHTATAKKPFLARELFLNRNLATAMFLIVITGLAMFATMALLPPMLQTIYGYSPIDAGILLAPRGVGFFISMGFAGRLSRIIDARIIVAVGLAIGSYSTWMMTGWSLEIDRWPIITSGFIQGIGMGAVFVSMNVLAFASLPPQFRTDAASMLNLSRTIGSSIGIAVFIGLLGRNFQTSHADVAGAVTDASLGPLGPTTLQRFGDYGGQIMMMIDAEVGRQALMIAYLSDFWLMSILTTLSIPLAFVMRKPIDIEPDSAETAASTH